jgi:hypothetical protein
MNGMSQLICYCSFMKYLVVSQTNGKFIMRKYSTLQLVIPFDSKYKFTVTYQDHLMKFLVLRLLYSKRKIVTQLSDICLLSGAPLILLSDNGRE